VDNRIREKLENLVRLAQRPGTPAEGEAARQAAIRLSLKYGIVCEFTAHQFPTSSRPTASTPPPNPTRQEPTESYDAIFYAWIKAVAGLGWGISECLETKVGRQIRFRKSGFNSEIRVTQRKNSEGREFECEHIMRPDPDQHGKDWSYTTYYCVRLAELLRHIEYTRDAKQEAPPKNDRRWWAHSR
jgi:hypothetical protein